MSNVLLSAKHYSCHISESETMIKTFKRWLKASCTFGLVGMCRGDVLGEHPQALLTLIVQPQVQLPPRLVLLRWFPLKVPPTVTHPQVIRILRETLRKGRPCSSRSYIHRNQTASNALTCWVVVVCQDLYLIALLDPVQLLWSTSHQNWLQDLKWHSSHLSDGWKSTNTQYNDPRPDNEVGRAYVSSYLIYSFCFQFHLLNQKCPLIKARLKT